MNAGSIGLPRDLTAPPGRFWRPPWAEWAMVEARDGRLSVALRRTPVDVEALIDGAATSGMPAVEGWIADWKREA